MSPLHDPLARILARLEPCSLGCGMGLWLGVVGSGGGTAAGPITTTALPANQIYDLDPDTLNGSLADGAEIASMVDSIGGYTATGGPTGERMLLKKSISNGHSVMRCQVPYARLQIGRPATVAAAMAAANTYSWSIVVRNPNRAVSGTDKGCLFGDESVATSATQLYRVSAGGINSKSGGNSNATPFNWRTGDPASGIHVITYSGDQAGPDLAHTGRVYVDGVQVYNWAGITIHATKDMYLGCLPLNGAFAIPGYSFQGDILRMKVWNTGLSGPQVQQEYQWACNYFGKTSPLAGMTYFPVFDGDSQTVGWGATISNNAWAFRVAESKGWINGAFAIAAKAGCTIVTGGGVNASNITDKGPRDVDGYRLVTGLPLKIIVGEWWNSSAVDHLTGSVAANAMRTYGTTRIAANSDTTLVCWTSFTSATQKGAERDAFNASLVANPGPYSIVVPIHTDPEIGVDNPPNFAARFPDGIHQDDVGHGITATDMQSSV